KAGIDLAAAETVGRHEDGVPAPGPAERRCGMLHVGTALRRGGVIGWRDGALLGAERLRRIATGDLDILRLDAAGRRQRIAHCLERVARADDMRNGLGADVPGRAVADAVDRSELRIGIGPLALLVVAEAQARATVVLDLDDEVRVGGAALDE